MIEIGKLIRGKHLTDLDRQVLQYIIDHFDSVLKMGVRKIAQENYTSPATVIRLSKKIGYSGFIDMYYNLLPQVEEVITQQKGTIEDFPEISPKDLLNYNSKHDIERFVQGVLCLSQTFIFIYATGFSGIAAEYLYKKILVLGKKAIFATGMDSVGVFENNLEDIGALVVISKSGETNQVIDRLKVAKKHGIFIVSFTKETKNTVAKLSDLNFKIIDNNKLDDRNMLPNLFFPRLLMGFELIIKAYLERKQ